MLKHIIMFKLKETHAGRSREENAETLVQMSQALMGKIPSLRTSQTHKNDVPGPINYDVVIELTFDDEAGMQSFHVHPLHMELVKFADAASEALAAVDYTF